MITEYIDETPEYYIKKYGKMTLDTYMDLFPNNKEPYRLGKRVRPVGMEVVVNSLNPYLMPFVKDDALCIEYRLVWVTENVEEEE